jgi:hypothetical protein
MDAINNRVPYVIETQITEAEYHESNGNFYEMKELQGKIFINIHLSKIPDNKSQVDYFKNVIEKINKVLKTPINDKHININPDDAWLEEDPSCDGCGQQKQYCECWHE